MLGLMTALSACDIAAFIIDPKPRLEQTWNLPASNSTITIASLLPTGNTVRVRPDSSGFDLTINPTAINSNVLGTYCARCLLLNGTSDKKPDFDLTTGNSTLLPQDVVAAAVTAGQLTLAMTNNLSFDPIRVDTAVGSAQGYLVTIIKSAEGLELARDTVKGTATAWPPGTTLNRVIPFNTGIVRTSIVVDMLLRSPAGDHDVPINANGTVNASAAVPSLTVGNVSVNVPSRNMASDSMDIDLDIDEGITNSLQRAVLQMTITNPIAISGNVRVKFKYGPLASDTVGKDFALPTGTSQVRQVSLNQQEARSIFGPCTGPSCPPGAKSVTVTVGGIVNATAPVTLTPRLRIDIENRLILGILTSAGGQ